MGKVGQLLFTFEINKKDKKDPCVKHITIDTRNCQKTVQNYVFSHMNPMLKMYPGNYYSKLNSLEKLNNPIPF